MRYSTTVRGKEIYKIETCGFLSGNECEGNDSLSAMKVMDTEQIVFDATYRRHVADMLKTQSPHALSESIESAFSRVASETELLGRRARRSELPRDDETLVGEAKDIFGRLGGLSAVIRNNAEDRRRSFEAKGDLKTSKQFESLQVQAVALENFASNQLQAIWKVDHESQQFRAAAARAYVKSLPTDFVGFILPQDAEDGSTRATEMDRFWSASVFEHLGSTNTVESKDAAGNPVTSTTEGPNPDLIRALSSTASIGQMRDLLMEPSFPHLVPLKRRVKLGCLPPSDNVVFEFMNKIQAGLKKNTTDGKGSDQSIEGSLNAEQRTYAIKVVEETQKTWFLQWALFRLCESTINSPAGFRNVAPVVIHDIVRRTAEMSDDAQVEISKAGVQQEQTRQEREKTRQEELKLEAKKVDQIVETARSENAAAETELLKQRQITACIEAKLKQSADGDPAEIKKSCKTGLQ